MLRNGVLEELYETNGKALGMDFTTDEDVLKNESGTWMSNNSSVLDTLKNEGVDNGRQNVYWGKTLQAETCFFYFFFIENTV